MKIQYVLLVFGMIAGNFQMIFSASKRVSWSDAVIPEKIVDCAVKKVASDAVDSQGEHNVHCTFERYMRIMQNFLIMNKEIECNCKQLDSTIRQMHDCHYWKPEEWVSWCSDQQFYGLYAFLFNKKMMYAHYDSFVCKKKNVLKKFERWMESEEVIAKIKGCANTADDDLCEIIFKTENDCKQFVDAQIVSVPEQFVSLDAVKTIWRLLFSVYNDEKVSSPLFLAQRYYFSIAQKFFKTMHDNKNFLIEDNQSLDVSIAYYKEQLDQRKDRSDDIAVNLKRQIETMLLGFEEQKQKNEKQLVCLEKITCVLRDEHNHYSKLASTDGIEIIHADFFDFEI